MRKVESFSSNDIHELSNKVNKFCENHNVIQISHSSYKDSYSRCYSCMVLYADEESETDTLINKF